MVIWVSLLIISLLGYSWLDLNKINSFLSILPSLVVAYIFGIIVDRLADRLFRRWDKAIRIKFLPRDFTNYQQIRTIIFDKSESLRSWFYYGRSRLRICRGWSFNLFLILISINLFLSLNFTLIRNKFLVLASLNTLLILLFLSTIFAWHQLTSSEYERLSQEYSRIYDQSNRLENLLALASLLKK